MQAGGANEAFLSLCRAAFRLAGRASQPKARRLCLANPRAQPGPPGQGSKFAYRDMRARGAKLAYRDMRGPGPELGARGAASYKVKQDLRVIMKHM